jgi:hypothetical protein
MKLIISIIVLFTLSSCAEKAPVAEPSVSVSDESAGFMESETLIYKYKAAKQHMILDKYIGDPNASYLTIPEEIKGYKVTEFSYDFALPKSLTGLSLPKYFIERPILRQRATNMNISGLEYCNLAPAKKPDGNVTIGRSGGFIYAAAEDGTARVLRYVAEPNETVLTVPGELDGYIVTEIWDYALSSESNKSKDSIATLVFPDSLRYIGHCACVFPNLTEVLGITDKIIISGYAFTGFETYNPFMKELAAKSDEFVILGTTLVEYKDVGKEEAFIPEGIVIIGPFALFHKSLKRVYIPASVRRIEDRNFVSEMIFEDREKIMYVEWW